MENLMKTPVEIAKYTIETAQAKVNKPKKILMISSFFSGAFIAFAGLCSLGATYGLFSSGDTYGLGKFFQGILFAAGLIFVIVLGSDLFTGNMLIIMGVLHKKVKVRQMLANWGLVWLGNLTGAIVVGFLIANSGVFSWSNGLYGQVLEKIAVGKSNIPFMTAFYSGIVCNWLVCLIVLGSYAIKEASGKLIYIIVGIMLFVAGGSEHVIANMGYYAGAFFARGNEGFVTEGYNTMADILDATSPLVILTKNFVPVTLGNIVGGALFVGILYYIMVKDKLKAE